MGFLTPVILFVAGLFGGGAGAILAANLIVGSLISVGVSAVIGGISKLLRKSPHIGASITQDGRSTTVRQPIAPRVVIYGRAGRIGGVITFIDVTGASNEFIHLVIVFTGHRIQSFDKIYFDGVEAWPSDPSGKFASAIFIDTRLGHDDDTAFADLIAYNPGKWTTNHRQRGCAKVYVRLMYSQAIFPNGVPNITADIHGKDDIYDPRIASSPPYTGYSENPALCLRDYLVNTRWGLQATDTEMDDVQTIAAANLCDEEVPVRFTSESPAVEPRYSMNGSFSTDTRPSDVIQSMLSAMAGRLVRVGGKFSIYPGAYLTPSVQFDEADLRGGVEVVTSVQKPDLCNGVKGVFISPSSEWQPTDFPPYLSAAFVAEDNGETLWRDVQLGWTVSPSMAQRLAKIELERTRRQTQVTLQCNLKAYRAKVLDTVELSLERYGWVNKTFEVADVKFALSSGTGGGVGLGVDLVLRETDANVFDWDAATEEKDVNTPTGTIIFPGATPPGTPVLVEYPFVGMPGDGVDTPIYTPSTDMILKANMPGSFVAVDSNPNANAVFHVKGSQAAYDGDGNFIGYNNLDIGTITILTDGSAVFVSTYDALLPAGEALRLVTPTPQDSLLADVTFSIRVQST